MYQKQSERNCQMRANERSELWTDVAAIEARIDEAIAELEAANARIVENPLFF